MLGILEDFNCKCGNYATCVVFTSFGSCDFWHPGSSHQPFLRKVTCPDSRVSGKQQLSIRLSKLTSLLRQLTSDRSLGSLSCLQSYRPRGSLPFAWAWHLLGRGARGDIWRRPAVVF